MRIITMEVALTSGAKQGEELLCKFKNITHKIGFWLPEF
jgi:hypothetical protein